MFINLRYQQGMDFDAYQKEAERTGSAVSDYRDRMLLGGIGAAEEGGEVLGVVKKWAFHGHPLNQDKLIKEMGDALWYLAFLATTLNISLSSVAEANVAKLAERYPDGFSPERSMNREREPLAPAAPSEEREADRRMPNALNVLNALNTLSALNVLGR